jgi:hypothetical protein
LLADRAAAVGSAVERRVVDHHQLPIGREMHIELDLLDREARRVLEGEPAVLRPQQRATPVRGDFGHAAEPRSPGDADLQWSDCIS